MSLRAFYHANRWIAKRGISRNFSSKPPPKSSNFKYGPTAALLGVGIAASYYFFSPDVSRSAPTLADQVLSPSHFTRCTVTSSEESGPDTRLITVTVPKQSIPPASSLQPVWSVFIKDDDIQVERPYTPLEGLDSEGRMRFWIKRYPRGEVGRWLHSKKCGEDIELRGPLQTWTWKEDTWDEVVMISGGTGITPFYQLFHSVISRAPSTSSTRFTLLHSSKTHAELPPSAILDPLVSYGEENPSKFQVHLFVDSSAQSSNTVALAAHVGRIGRPEIVKSLQTDTSKSSWWNTLFGRNEKVDLGQRKILFLVCGPEPLV
ncbi:hypothetical protein V5O48_008242 [Marasmius crinis-equi]|uniref:FAD-binding FR-type domain-containing protein n=1 Tax=Marasmius crinis-equi TaxID=585013 RepID=A0ABR3FEX9_9AGAR